MVLNYILVGYPCTTRASSGEFQQPLSGKQQKENIDVIADLAMNHIRPALNVCVALSRYVLFILFL